MAAAECEASDSGWLLGTVCCGVSRCVLEQHVGCRASSGVNGGKLGVDCEVCTCKSGVPSQHWLEVLLSVSFNSLC